MNLEAVPRVRDEVVRVVSLVIRLTELIVLREIVSMIMFANPTSTAMIIPREKMPPVTERYYISLSYRNISVT